MIGCALVLAALGLLLGVPAPAQMIGEEAEMERLQAKAAEAADNGDADGAAMQIGRAALMAAQVAKRQQHDAAAQWYRGAEALFRAEEHAYRAQALFLRAGGELPASSGVCGSLALARRQTEKAVALLVDAVPPATANPEQAAQMHRSAMEWIETVDQMTRDFRCQ